MEHVRNRTPIAERFATKYDVEPTTGCWLWTGARRHDGRPVLRGPGKETGNLLAYRVSWEIHNGTIPDGAHVCHRCDTPECVNPGHLFLGDQSLNALDMWAKGRGVDPPHKLVHDDEVIREIHRAAAAGESQTSISRRLGLPGGYASRVLRGLLRPGVAALIAVLLLAAPASARAPFDIGFTVRTAHPTNVVVRWKVTCSTADQTATDRGQFEATTPVYQTAPQTLDDATRCEIRVVAWDIPPHVWPHAGQRPQVVSWVHT